MSRLTHYGHGVYCYKCQEVHDGTDGCEHTLSHKAGVQKELDGGYVAQPSDMGHNTPHQYIDVDGLQMCAHCDQVKLPTEWVDDA